jgi:hypothetical protein
MRADDTPQEKAERKTAMWKRTKSCNIIGIAIGIGLIAPIAGLLMDRREPIHLYQGRFEPEVVRSNQTVQIIWEADELRTGCDGVLERRITEKRSGKIHYFAREPTVFHFNGTRKTFSKYFTLPELSDGEAEYTTHGHRWCNLLQKWFWPIEFFSPPIRFTVSNPPKVVSPDDPVVVLPKDFFDPETIKQLLQQKRVPR